MGKIYFIAETKYGEETITSDELYYIGDHDGSILFDNIFKITDLDEYMKAPNRQEFTQTIILMVTVFISLVAVYLFAKVVTYLFDEIRFSIRTIIKNHRRRKKK